MPAYQNDTWPTHCQALVQADDATDDDLDDALMLGTPFACLGGCLLAHS